MGVQQIGAGIAPVQTAREEAQNSRLVSFAPESSFQRMIEKAMNEYREIDKAREEKRAAETRTEKPRENPGAKNEAKDDRVGKAEETGRDETRAGREGALSGEVRRPAERGGEAPAVMESVETPAALDVPVDAEMELTLGGLAPEIEGGEEPATAVEAAAELPEASLAQTRPETPEDSFLMGALREAALQSPGADAGEAEEIAAKPDDEEDPRERALLASESLFGARDGSVLQTTEIPLQAQVPEEVPQVKPEERQFFVGEKPLITVIDERRDPKPEKQAGNRSEGGRQETPLFAGTGAKAAPPGGTEQAAGPESRFASMLSQEIRNNAAEFVKAGSIVLRDNDSGTIRLVLNPRELGEVKIHLRISDNTIDAKIAVATKDAFDAFKSSIGSLKEAFTSGGFSAGDFNLSWTGGGSGEQRGQHNGETLQSAAFEYAALAPDLEAGEKSFWEVGTYAVNIMA
ncbi:MAG: flagellar hook-length control protein FliK [Spirochaetaceae bacterium]|jgi:flagellar hook-length control protein FliK|nr:flagellar hook-length control protein FliK [Spirochaetaceae bacterium]